MGKVSSVWIGVKLPLPILIDDREFCMHPCLADKEAAKIGGLEHRR